MSKVAAIATATTGAAATSVGGVYILQKGVGLSKVDTKKKDSPAPQAEVTIDFEDLSSFKSGMVKSKCVSDYFGNEIKEENNSSISLISKTSPVSNVFFKTQSSETPESYKSCLSINGKIAKYETEDKWNGKFTLLWTFMRGDEGFINFNIVESSDEANGKLKFTGVFYLVGKKENENQKWEIKHKKEISANTPSDPADPDQYFPKAGNDLKGDNGDYWGFVDSKDKLTKSCKTGDCGTNSKTNNTPINKKFSFDKGSDANKKLSGWTSGLDWWKKLYSDIGWEFENKISGFYGEWKPSTNQ